MISVIIIRYLIYQVYTHMLYNRFVKFKKVKKWQEKRGKEKLKCIYTANLESTSAIQIQLRKIYFVFT